MADKMSLRILFAVLRRFLSGSVLFLAFSLLLYYIMQAAADHTISESKV